MDLSAYGYVRDPQSGKYYRQPRGTSTLAAGTSTGTSARDGEGNGSSSWAPVKAGRATPSSARVLAAIASSSSNLGGASSSSRGQGNERSTKRRKLGSHSSWGTHTSTDEKGRCTCGAAQANADDGVAFAHPASLGALSSLKLARESHAVRSLVYTHESAPAALPVGESVSALALDATRGEIWLGGDQGTLISGAVERVDPRWPDERLVEEEQARSTQQRRRGRRRSWEQAPPSERERVVAGVPQWGNRFTGSSAVMGLSCVNSSLVAATFGPQAQAFITSTQARMSLALTPPRASFWTCALSRSRHPPHSGDGVCGGGDLVAFGADGKLFTMRVREQGDTAGRISAHGGTMRTYKTGSDVFALDVLENDAVSHTIIAGTRKGHVKLFDERQGSNDVSSRPDIQFRLASACTHVRHLGDTRLLAASMNGDLAVYDTRFPPSRSRGGPLLALEGHSNAYTTSLGFDVYRDNFVALAGQDRRVRIWSLDARAATRKPLSEPTRGRGYAEAVRALLFVDPDSLGTAARAKSRGKAQGPLLALADGPVVQFFETQSIS